MPRRALGKNLNTLLGSELTECFTINFHLKSHKQARGGEAEVAGRGRSFRRFFPSFP